LSCIIASLYYTLTFSNDSNKDFDEYSKGMGSMYCKEVRLLGLRLLEVISKSLGLEANFLGKTLGKHEQHMVINYYPKCPNHELTFGIPSHSDPIVLTLLLHDEVSVLQVLNNGHWIATNPIPNYFVIEIGDQLQVPSICLALKLINLLF